MSEASQAGTATVSFTSMAAGTREDYELLERLEAEFAAEHGGPGTGATARAGRIAGRLQG